MRNIDSEVTTKFFSIRFAVGRTDNERIKIYGSEMSQARLCKK
jgi:hypothetical protein